MAAGSNTKVLDSAASTIKNDAALITWKAFMAQNH
jgi:hypothetical protein